MCGVILNISKYHISNIILKIIMILQANFARSVQKFHMKCIFPILQHLKTFSKYHFCLPHRNSKYKEFLHTPKRWLSKLGSYQSYSDFPCSSYQTINVGSLLSLNSLHEVLLHLSIMFTTYMLIKQYTYITLCSAVNI